MSKEFKLIKSNIRTSRGASICVFVLLFVAALLFNIALILNSDYKNNFYRQHDALNAEHVTVALSTSDPKYSSFVEKLSHEDSRIASYESINSIVGEIKLPFNGADYTTTAALLKEKDAFSKAIGQLDIVDSINEKGLYMPYLFNKNGYAIGDIVHVTFADCEEKEYKVVGFFNSVMSGSNNCGLTAFVLTNDLYDDISTHASDTYHGYLLSYRLKDAKDSEKFEAYISDLLKSELEVRYLSSNNLALTAQARYITQMISTAIILVVALLVVAIAVVISSANLSEYIKENMKKIGALKAIGYTSRDLILSFVFQFGGIALLATLTGVGISYIVFPALNELLLGQTGIPYQICFLPAPALISVLVLTLCIVLAILISCLKLRKIEAIDALREGITTHSFKKNIFGLENTRFSLNLRMGLKNAVTNVRVNITTIITTIVLAFVVVFDVFLLFNSVISFDPMVKLIVAITPDGTVSIQESDKESLLHELSQDSSVEKYYLCSDSDVKILDNPIWLQIVDDGRNVEEDLIWEGKAPVYENEIAVGGKFAKDNGIRIGQSLSVSLNGKTIDFIVTGYTQNSNYLGKDAVMTAAGFEQFEYEYHLTYNLYFKEGTDISEKLKSYEDTYDARVVNFGSVTEAFTGVYRNLLSMIFYAIILITGLVLAFVLFLQVRGLLEKKKKDFGIQKAIGYTTRDLMKETVISFLPALFIGALSGVIIGYFGLNPIMSIALSGIGILHCNLTMPFYGAALGGFGLILLALLLVYALSLRIRKVEAYKLLIAE